MSEIKTWQEKLNDERASGSYGCIVEDGWQEIVLEADRMLSYLDPNYTISQVKEKFGTLRYYFETNETGIVYEIMEAVAGNAEQRSARVCQQCGKYGELRTQHYYMLTLCDSCNAARDEEILQRKQS